MMILSIDINEWINIKSMILARVFLFDKFLGGGFVLPSFAFLFRQNLKDRKNELIEFILENVCFFLGS